ncbi:MAG: cellulase family glycosylhydrolase [Muribaculaceae bacterium]|nr:cellulase family glycosylhydrolase [Muribaculaceae bacterium]
MNRTILALISFIIFGYCEASQYNIYVDKEGVMRRDDTRQEVSYYGVNYTLPFAHAYRAIDALGKNHKAAIDKDVYHFSRLGFNAYRIHIWDVEITDSIGNIINNDHLDLLDYLISELEKRDIRVIITTQTNFGNGYPERNINTGGYSYHYDKCKVHDTESAIKAQERYVSQLLSHKNSYTGKNYSKDNMIIAYEINNEPCHSGSEKEIKRYINRMVEAMRKTGLKAPILYNVSHNMYATESFYDSKIQGTTYQWYPMGLVAGKMRKGNYLPAVDFYNIPFDTIPNYKNKARIVYEFDPADNLYSFMHTAMARTFRSAGFQWITQFAYDPMDIAWANTEYQTHYLNLAYTPSKAIGMKIAAEVARNVKRGEKFAKYPQDTIFGDFKISYKSNLSEMNSSDKFFYSNTTTSFPINIDSLKEIAGVGSSAIVKYSGTGAYFIDKIDQNTWRLEVMPDIMLTKDPFEKPSLSRKVGEIVYSTHLMSLELPRLGKNYKIKGINEGNNYTGKAKEGSFKVYPGVYLLSSVDINKDLTAQSQYKNIKMGEYAAPENTKVKNVVIHTPKMVIEKGNNLIVKATVFGSELPDSVVVYPQEVSFWNDNNVLYTMKHIGGYDYQAVIPTEKMAEKFKYNIVVFDNSGASTYPQGTEGTPITWDYAVTSYYTTSIVDANSPIVLVKADNNLNGIETAIIPEGGGRNKTKYVDKEPIERSYIEYKICPNSNETEGFITKYVGDIVADYKNISKKSEIIVDLDFSNRESIEIVLISNLGISYNVPFTRENNRKPISLSAFTQCSTTLIPAPYPIFLKREFVPDENLDLKIGDIERIEIRIKGMPEKSDTTIKLYGIWLR